MYKVNNLFPSFISSGGIFKAISSLNDYISPWFNKINDTSLDLQYHGNRSGNKYISPLIENMLLDNSEDIPEKLARICVNIYGENWVKLWTSYNLNYNPLENFEIIEELESTETVIENSDSENIIDYGKITGNNASTTNDIDNSVYAFNSSSSSPTESVVNNGTMTNSETTTGNDTNTISRTDNGNRTKDQTINRHGNTGILKQDMLIKELEIRQWQFFDIVFKNIDAILTIKIY